MIRKTAVALAVAAGFAGVIGLAGPAFAAPNGTANPGEVVVWKNTGFTGPLYDFGNDVSCYNDGAPGFFTETTTLVNDNASSIANYDSARKIQAYVDCGYQGSFLQLLQYGVVNGSGLSYAYSSLGTFDNQFSSHHPAG